MSKEDDGTADKEGYSRRGLLVGWVGGVSTAVLGLSAATFADDLLGIEGTGNTADGTEGSGDTGGGDGPADGEPDDTDTNEFGLDEPSLEETVSMLREGGYNLYFRHEKTQDGRDQHLDDPDADPEKIPGYYENCSLQRNLSLEGWRRAERVGEAFDKLDIPVERVLSSPYCRCKHHAELAFGEYTVTQDLNRDGEDFVGRRINLLTQTPDEETNIALVSHSLSPTTQEMLFGNISSENQLSEGDMMVFNPKKGIEEGVVRYINPDELIEFVE